MPGKTSSVFTHDKRQDGWLLLYNRDPIISHNTTLTLRELEIEFNEELMSVRDNSLKIGANLGQQDAEYLLEHPEKIPVISEKGTLGTVHILFPGTIWCNPNPRELNLLIPMMWKTWQGDEWELSFRSFFDCPSLGDRLLSHA